MADKRYYAGVLALLWLVCGFFAWGVSMGEIRHEHHGWSTADCRHDQAFTAMWGVAGGPLTLTSSMMISGFAEHGTQWTCPDPEAK
jgi:hypothetical protein